MDQWISNSNDGIEEEIIRTESESMKRSGVGLFVAGVVGTAAIGLSVLTVPFLAPALRKVCLPFVPATETQVRNVITALKLRNAEVAVKRRKLVDLGSGDGRLVFEATKIGFSADGVELNRLLVWYSRFSARSKGFHHKTNFIRKDLFKIDLSAYDHVIIFGVDEMMKTIEEKASKEMCSYGGRLIACRFPLPSKQPTATIGTGIDTVWVYDFRQEQK